MGEPTLLDNIREWISGIAFDVYLWAIQMTQEQFWEAQELDAIEHGLPNKYHCRCPSCNHIGPVSRYLIKLE